MAIIYNTNISYAYDTTHACLSLLYLGLCQPAERLSVSDVDMDGSCSLALAQMTACYAIISETNLHCSHLAALSARGASACAASRATMHTVPRPLPWKWIREAMFVAPREL